MNRNLLHALFLKRTSNLTPDIDAHPRLPKLLLLLLLIPSLLLAGCGRFGPTGPSAVPQAVLPSHSASAALPAGNPSDATAVNGQPGLAGVASTIREAVGAKAETFTAGSMDSAFSMEAPRGFVEPVAPEPEMNTEAYAPVRERGFVSPLREPLSTFSADVDTASWSNIRRFVNMGVSIPPDAVRIEEMINYFPYDYEGPSDALPFAVHPELSVCPWNTDHLVMRIGIQGRRMAQTELPPSNLVFLLDVSGSMNDPMKLPLVKQAFSLLVEQLDETDRVSIVTYAGDDQIVLEGASGMDKTRILTAIDTLAAGGSTAGAQGIVTAYKLAERLKLEAGNNRVILATDGDFNVGISSDGELLRLIEKEREKGIFLSVLGFGMGNLKDDKMEILADNGNGNYGYIDSVNEARKLLVSEMGGTLFTIAKDVKFQVEFNPAMVKGYRLVGYEDRMLAAEDFNNDAKDAGDIGAGHSVTALYELIPAGSDEHVPDVDPLRYGETDGTTAVSEDGSATGTQENADEKSDEWLTVKIRYKAPDSEVSELLVFPVEKDARKPLASVDFMFQCAVAESGLVLRDSVHAGAATLSHAVSLARSAMGEDAGGYRTEFVYLLSQLDPMREVDAP